MFLKGETGGEADGDEAAAGVASLGLDEMLIGISTDLAASLALSDLALDAGDIGGFLSTITGCSIT